MIFDAKKVEGWAHHSIADWCRLYWLPNKDGNGFEFVSFEVTSMASRPDDPYCKGDPFTNSDSDTDVEILLWGTAMFDGVRHLYFGHKKSENFGYFYYPNFERITAIMAKIQEIERQYCSAK